MSPIGIFDRVPAIRAALLSLLGGFLLTAGGCAPNSSAGGPPRSLLSLAQVERRSGEVVSLSLTSKALTSEEFAQVANYPALERLTLQEARGLDRQSLKPLGQLPNLQVLHCIRVPLNDAVLQQLSADKSLRDLLLAHTEVTGRGMDHLREAPLERLELHGASFTSEGLACLPQLITLRELVLACPHLALAQLPPLAPLTRLERLDLFYLPLGPHGVRRLEGLPSLRELNLNADDLADEDLPVFATMPELARLELFNAPITDAGLESLAHGKLTHLSLSGCVHISDAGLANLKNLTNLQSLNLSDSGVTGRALTPLAQIRTLKKVELTAGQFKGGKAAIDDLKRQLPDCEVVVIQG